MLTFRALALRRSEFIGKLLLEQYFAVVLFVFLLYPVCDFGKFSSYGLRTVKSERVNQCISDMLPFIGKLLSGTLLWCWLFFNVN